jgi:serine/threonine protein kinase
VKNKELILLDIVDNLSLMRLFYLVLLTIELVGYNKLTRKNVAIKIMKKNKLKFNNCMNKVYKEIAINKYLDHPHITKLYDHFETEQEIFLIFEYVPNGELFEIITYNTNIPEETARKYFQQLISALDYVHKSGVTHRDLKPENILLDENDNIKLLDFGFANLLKDGRCLRTSCGSPNYAAPEVILAKYVL